MKINAIICPKCKIILYSRAQHDFRSCGKPCNLIMVDGGLEYLRYGYNRRDDRYKSLKFIQFITLNLDVTIRELYDDWNKNINKLGRIKLDKKQLKLLKLLYL